MSLVSIQWSIRPVPLIPCAVAATEQSAIWLAQRLLLRPETTLMKMNGAIGKNLLIILSEEDLLPWSEGAIYLGRDPEAHNILLPTTRNQIFPVRFLNKLS